MDSTSKKKTHRGKKVENKKRLEKDGVRVAAFHATYDAAGISSTTSVEIPTPVFPLPSPTPPFRGLYKCHKRKTVWASLPTKTHLDYPSPDVKKLCKTLVGFLRDASSGVKDHPVNSSMLRWLNSVIIKQNLQLP